VQRVVARAALTLAAFAAVLLGILHPRPGTIHKANAAACSEVTVGAVLSLTGERSANGIQIRNGYEYARRRINEAGGIPVQGGCHNLRVIYYDDESSAGRAAQLTERLIVRDRIRLLLGPAGLEATEAVGVVAARHQVPVVSIAGRRNDGAQNNQRFHFAIDRAPSRYLAGLTEYAAYLAPQIGREPGDLRMAVLHDGSRTGASAPDPLRDSARRLGIQIVLDRQIGREAGDISQELSKIKSERPNLLLIDANADRANRALKMLREMHIEPAILAMADCASARVLARFGAKAEKIVCVAGWGAELAGEDSFFVSPAAFASDYLKHKLRKPAQKQQPPVSASVAQAAVAVRVMAAGIERAGTLDHVQVRDALAAIDLDTIVGHVSFGPRPSHDEKTRAVIRQISDGRYVTVWPTAVAKGTYRWPASVQLPF